MKTAYQIGYFAHSKKEYNKEIESLAYDFISKIFYGHIICPNKHVGELNSIEPYLSIVKKVDCIFVLEHNNFLGRGTYTECLTALENKIPVYAVKVENQKIHLEKVTSVVKICEYNLIEYGYLTSIS